MSLVDDLAQAIARFESGNFNPASLAMRNNNPGNLRSWGNYPTVNGYVQFPDFATGMNALKTQVQRNIDRGLTLSEFFQGKPGVYGGYAPAGDANDPTHYAATVAGWMGIAPDVPLSSVAGGAPGGGTGFQLPDLAAAVSGVIDWGASVDSGMSPALVAGLVVGGASLLWLALS